MTHVRCGAVPKRWESALADAVCTAWSVDCSDRARDFENSGGQDGSHDVGAPALHDVPRQRPGG